MDVQKIVEQAQAMQAKMEELQGQLEAEESTGHSGGNLVSVTLNGKGNALRCSVDDTLLSPDNREILEDLIVAAFNDAKSQVEVNFANKMKYLAGNMVAQPQDDGSSNG